MEKSKEKIRVVLIKKKCIDEKYPVKVNEIFLNPPSNCAKLTFTAHRSQKTRVLNRKTQLILLTAGRRGRQNVCV